MLWHIPAACTEGKIELNRTPISPWVKDVEVGYYSKARNLWEYESLTDHSRGAKRPAPGALRIVFEQDSREEQIRSIRMKRYDRNVLIY